METPVGIEPTTLSFRDRPSLSGGVPSGASVVIRRDTGRWWPTMTLHKLRAGDGYTYLTRQVAAGAEGRPSGQQLSDYYSASGNPPGRWSGSGAADLEVTGATPEGARAPAVAGGAVEDRGAGGPQGPPGGGGLRLVFPLEKSASLLWAPGNSSDSTPNDHQHQASEPKTSWLPPWSAKRANEPPPRSSAKHTPRQPANLPTVAEPSPRGQLKRGQPGARPATSDQCGQWPLPPR
ncbi:hypothetical protein BH10ACT10_BH10ACT10_00040 [soil metagenome]